MPVPLGGYCAAESVKTFVLYGDDRLILFTKDSFGIHLNFQTPFQIYS